MCLGVLDNLHIVGNHQDAGQLVDPKVLSVKQLRWILQERQVDCSGVIEKIDLVCLVNRSGLLTKSFAKHIEFETEREINGTMRDIHFVSAEHYVKMLEDYHSYIWIISIESKDGRSLLELKKGVEQGDCQSYSTRDESWCIGLLPC